MAKILYLYTLNYPFGRKEAYLESEANVLSEKFDEVVVLPYNSRPNDSRGDRRKVPSNFKVIDLFYGEKDYLESTAYRFDFFLAARKKLSFIKDWRYQLSLSGEYSKKASVLKQFLSNEKEGLHYSYWFNDWAIILAFLCKKKVLKDYVSRAHGFDLYEERERLSYQPWRRLQLEYISKVFTVSGAGQDYLQGKYPKEKNKVNTSYLGTTDHGMGKVTSNDAFHIVSCSNIVGLKRVDRIISSLSLVKKNVRWTHIGTGANLSSLREQAAKLPSNITCDLKGSLTNKEVMDFYKNEPIDGFINVSTTEGLPVAMMEAISFGIPIIGTDVGGVKEIVTEETGLLIPVNFEDEFLANQISIFLDRFGGSIEVKNRVREFWKKNFDALNNYEEFTNRIGVSDVV